MSDFYQYFKENMDGLGLPAPESLFGTASAAIANAAAILGQIDKMGKTVTVGELVGAGTILEGAGYLSMKQSSSTSYHLRMRTFA